VDVQKRTGFGSRAAGLASNLPPLCGIPASVCAARYKELFDAKGKSIWQAIVGVLIWTRIEACPLVYESLCFSYLTYLIYAGLHQLWPQKLATHLLICFACDEDSASSFHNFASIAQPFDRGPHFHYGDLPFYSPLSNTALLTLDLEAVPRVVKMTVRID